MHQGFDEQLIGRIAEGDGSAFRELYEATSSAVYGYALSVLKNRHDAEDVMHDAYLRIYDSAPSYRPMGKPLAWILTIVRNLCMSRLREVRPAEYTEENAASAASVFPEEAAETKLILNAALLQLSDEECQIVTLHALTGWKMREIAALTGIPLSTVLSKYRRALKKMKQELEKKGVYA